jgi:hypothetical protein
MIKLMGIVTGKSVVSEASNPHENPEVLALSKKIAKLTDRNDHTASVMELAKFLKDTKAIKKLEAVETIHKIEGSMPSEISKYRNVILNGLMDTFGDKYSLTDYTNLKGAF